MRINVDNFKDVLTKATLNFSIQSVKLDIDPQKIKSKMISENSNAIVDLEVENNLMGISEELEFTFSEPAQNLMPFLKLIDDEHADIIIRDNGITLKSGSQKSVIHFCSPQVVSVFTGQMRDIDFFISLEIDDDFLENFKKLKKIGSRFGKVYFGVEDKKFIMETSDRTNRFSNGLKFNLLDDIDEDDKILRFDFKRMVDLMNVIGSRDDFKFDFTYVEDQERGMLLAKNNDESEKYLLMSGEM